MNNAKTEDVAKVKLHVWWHLIWLLGSKISTNFDAVNMLYDRFLHLLNFV